MRNHVTRRLENRRIAGRLHLRPHGPHDNRLGLCEKDVGRSNSGQKHHDQKEDPLAFPGSTFEVAPLRAVDFQLIEFGRNFIHGMAKR